MLVYLDRQIKNTLIQFNTVCFYFFKHYIYHNVWRKNKKEIYVNNNFPSLQKLYLLVKKLDNTINKNEVKEFLDKQYNYQVLKQQNKIKQSGHIIAFRPNELWQMDIFDLKKYAPYNKNYGYLFVIVDVFTRKAGLMPMKQKKCVIMFNFVTRNN